MRLFKKLDIFMLKQFSLLFAGTFFISLFVLMMQFLWRYVDELIGKGLSLEVLAQFFWYMGLMLVPQALPLAVLLASLITMGNLGESMELTAIKAAGISLLKALRGLIIASVFVAMASFVFQNNIGPQANTQLRQLLISMKQKSPELEIPEEVFYNGIPGCNLYVQHKDLDKGMLYGIMIYRMTNSFEDAAIILADSGKLQSTAEKKHLLLTLHSGEWFENMPSHEMTPGANVPYRRESFMTKVIVLDFDNGFNLADNSGPKAAQSQSIAELTFNIDSMRHVCDSMGQELGRVFDNMVFTHPKLEKGDTVKALAQAKKQTMMFDSIMSHVESEKRKDLLVRARSRVEMANNDLDYRGMITEDNKSDERQFRIELVNKFTLSLICIVFFFIGASLGAIIRKGGLGVPVIISVLVFIVFYILDNTGYRMARQGLWSVALGKGLAPAVLIPIAVFVTYKANKDSVVFNMDAYRLFFIRLFGLRVKRNVMSKEVIISDPDYNGDVQRLQSLSLRIAQYSEEHHLMRLPNPVNVFFKYQPDSVIEEVAKELESVIDDLSNTRDRYIMSYLNQYPVLSEKAHTRPFDRQWLNVASAIILPIGIVLYIRMCRFRLRLYRDLKQVSRTNEQIIDRILNNL